MPSPPALPKAFLGQDLLEGFRGHKLRDEEYREKGARKETPIEEGREVAAGIREKMLSLITPDSC